MSRAARWMAVVLLLPALIVRGGEGEPADAEETEAEAAPAEQQPAKPASTNSPAPALVGLLLGAGTGALIFSGVDWRDDDNGPLQEIPGAAALNTPADGAVLSGPLLAFSWKAVKGASSYLIDIDTCDDTAICADFRFDRTTDLSLTVEWPAGVPAGRWRVRSIDADNLAGPWSDFRSFTVTPAAE
ncbi:MAG TPA: hypothetical protein PKE12_10135 [Kiritimatiellia bacterium]|nr:hypothetical protein [Kiritimatiellia bacterium]